MFLIEFNTDAIGNKISPTGAIFCIKMILIFLMPHRGFNPTPCFDLWLATFHIVEMLYHTPYPETPQTDRVEKLERNAEIIARYGAGETGSSLAEAFGISEQRVNQIVHGQHR
jgi:hypothetical protein